MPAGRLVLGNDHNRRVADAGAWILGGRSLRSPGDHHAEVHVVGRHVVGADGLVHLVDERFRGHPQIIVQGLCIGLEAGHVLLHKGELAVVQTKALPKAVADREGAVKDRYLGLIPWEQLTIYINEDIPVPFVCGESVCLA